MDLHTTIFFPSSTKLPEYWHLVQVGDDTHVVGSEQQSQSLNEVKANSEGGVFLTLPRVLLLRVHNQQNEKPTGGQTFLPRFPSIKSDPESDEDEPIQDKADRIMTRSRYLPGTRYYASNHVMMNRERTKRTIAPLVRMPELDEIVRFHVKAMSKENLA
jgi:hypothetical protein